MRRSIYLYNMAFHNKQWINRFTTPFIVMLFNILLIFDVESSHDFEENIQAYRRDKNLSAAKWKIRQAMLTSYVESFISPYEFRSFDLYKRSSIEKKNFMSNVEVVNLFCRNKSMNYLPRNKYERYLLFKEYYKRDIIHLIFDGNIEEIATYDEFRNNHSDAIIKPIKGKEGHGIEKISIDKIDYSQLKSIYGYECILEEVMKQDERLAIFHPSSINTIRFVSTLDADGKWSVLYTLFRTGSGGSVVDNVGSGGFICLVNSDGIISSEGTKNGRFFSIHPDSNIQFKGYSIPNWRELCVIAEVAHRSMPQQRLFGWDFALTNKGWDLVEVNPSPSFVSYQIITQEGMRNRLYNQNIL